MKQLFDYFDPQLKAMLWITHKPLNSNLRGFYLFDTIFDGLLTQSLNLKKSTDEELNIAPATHNNLFMGPFFQGTIFLGHLFFPVDFQLSDKTKLAYSSNWIKSLIGLLQNQSVSKNQNNSANDSDLKPDNFVIFTELEKFSEYDNIDTFISQLINTSTLQEINKMGNIKILTVPLPPS
jgi:hypothetical protein